MAATDTCAAFSDDKLAPRQKSQGSTSRGQAGGFFKIEKTRILRIGGILGKTQKAKWLISGYNRQPDALYTEVKKSMEK